MSATILITGFGPFPGAPRNPTGALARALARHRHANARRVAHVFETSYAAVDRDLPALLARERPDVLIMFGLAQRSRRLRIETQARNVIATTPDVSGHRPAAHHIAAEAAETMPLPAPVRRLLAAARSTGLPAALSHDAGSYLCNYLCWRACEAATPDTHDLRLAAFVHVPNVIEPRPRYPLTAPRSRIRTAFTLADLVRAGEAIVRTAVHSSPID